MGRKLVLTGTKLTDLTAPKLATIDMILPEAGALLFLEPGHPYNPAGVFDLNSTALTNGPVLPNLAYDQAKLMYPAGTEATLGAKYIKGVDMLNDGVSSRVERTGKGGLHVQFSQTVGDTTKGGRSAKLFGHDGINAYLGANKANSFYAAMWGKVTRGAKAFSSGSQQLSAASTNNTLFNFYTRPGTAGDFVYPTANPPRIGWMQEGASNSATAVNVPLFFDGAVNSAAAASTLSTPFTISANPTADGLNAGSIIFYGYYMEDLTVSGRTYAQVNALVKAKYDKDVKTAGGRYFGDTYSAPLA